jgi:hypothetical protein
VHQKENPQKPPAKVKRTSKEMQITLENRKKTTTNLQEVFLRREKELRKVEPQAQELKRNKKAQKQWHKK